MGLQVDPLKERQKQVELVKLLLYRCREDEVNNSGDTNEGMRYVMANVSPDIRADIETWVVEQKSPRMMYLWREGGVLPETRLAIRQRALKVDFRRVDGLDSLNNVIRWMMYATISQTIDEQVEFFNDASSWEIIYQAVTSWSAWTPVEDAVVERAIVRLGKLVDEQFFDDARSGRILSFFDKRSENARRALAGIRASQALKILSKWDGGIGGGMGWCLFLSKLALKGNQEPLENSCRTMPNGRETTCTKVPFWGSPI